jgi:superfamily II DNA or RNA helicase
MFVVHGWWSVPSAGDGTLGAGALTLWAEDSRAAPAEQPGAGRRPRVRAHPFAADGEELAVALGLGPDLPAGSAELTLPSYSQAPAASPELLDLHSSGDAGGETLRLRPEVRWRVPTISVDAAEALVLLPWLVSGEGGYIDGVAGPVEVPGAPGAPGPGAEPAPGAAAEPAAEPATEAERTRFRPPNGGVSGWDPGAGRGGSPEPATEAERTRFRPPNGGVSGWNPGDGLGAGSAGRESGPEPGGVEGSVLGSELRGLAAVATFAADLVARGRVLPVALEGREGTGLARWRPVLTGGDAEWFRALVAALPPSYQASFAPTPVPGQALRASAAAALDALTDAAVRARVGEPTRNAKVTGPAAWRRALRGSDPTFEVTRAKLAEIQADLAAWQADAVGGPPVHACFRLVEPTDDDEAGVLRRPSEPLRDAGEGSSWRLEFGLQPVAEPSLVVLARQIWGGDPIQQLARHAPRPAETLLAELGRALRLYPQLHQALTQRQPTELLLDANQAHSFLADAAPLLIGAGFGVLLPGWWSDSRARLGARLKATTPGQPGRVEGKPQVGQTAIVEFDWRLSIGDQQLTDSEVEALIERQQSLVKIRGEWMQVDPERLRKARDFLKRRRRGAGQAGMTVAEVLRVLGALDDGPGGLPVTGVDAEGWLGELLSGTHEQRHVEVPDTFKGTLRPYQERGLAWLAYLEETGVGAVLADDMGLGKTIQLLALISRDVEENRPENPTLLVCPTSLVGNWEREAARFTPDLRLHVHHGSERPQGEEFRAAVDTADVVVTTYNLLARDAVPLRAVEWRRVVLDEAQAVKNAATQAATAARKLNTQRRIAVTGTPVENRLADLWSLMEFANPRLLGDPVEFKRKFALPIERVHDQEAADRLKALTRPFILRRVKTDRSVITDLPEKLEMEVVCSLTAEQAALYQGTVAHMLERIGDKSGIERRGLVLAAMTKLKQVCNHPAQFLRDGSRIAGRSGKLARLEETVEEILAAGEKALLFTQYAEFGEMLRTHLTARFGREVAFLHGGTSRERRDELVARFQSGERGSPSLFVLSLKAGGTGLTLTAANHVIHVDRWWNPAVEDQATDRAFRIGQQRRVQVRKFVTAGTLEEKISTMIQDKRGLAASIVGSGETWLTELSTAELADLFTLERS